MESKQSMAMEGGQGTGSRLADLQLDDLLGLSDHTPQESPVQTPTPPTPGAFDPFKSQQVRAGPCMFKLCLWLLALALCIGPPATSNPAVEAALVQAPLLNVPRLPRLLVTGGPLQITKAPSAIAVNARINRLARVACRACQWQDALAEHTAVRAAMLHLRLSSPQQAHAASCCATRQHCLTCSAAALET